MNRGFTLFELVLTVAVLGITLAMAAPSFSNVIKAVQVQRLATELNGFFIQAKTEAVMRNKPLYLHFSFASGSEQKTDSWVLTLSDAKDKSKGNTISVLSGHEHGGIHITHAYSEQFVTFGSVRGRPSPGSVEFYAKGESSKTLKLITANPPGRVKLCGKNGALYDYAQCPKKKV